MPGRAWLYALSAVLLWSTVASVFKLTLRHVDFIHLLLISSWTAFLALFLVLAAQGKVALLRRLTGRELLRSAGLGALNPYLYYLVLFKAYSLIPAQEALALNYTWPVVLVLLSVPLLGQRIGAGSVAAILVSFSGVVLIATRGEVTGLAVSHPLGAALALGSSLIWALFWIFNLRDRRDPVLRLFLSFGFGSLFILATVLLGEGIRIPAWPGLLGGLYSGLFEMGLTFLLWLKALELASTTAQVSNLVFLAPFLSLVFIRVLVGEPILPSTLAGLVLIICGILIQQRLERT
ncbi:MAG: DMT family transporter [Candidatus Aminicenantes bacterium]|nr:DMT family transporter [Candidatus Aminicenantes bacterium]